MRNDKVDINLKVTWENEPNISMLILIFVNFSWRKTYFLHIDHQFVIKCTGEISSLIYLTWSKKFKIINFFLWSYLWYCQKTPGGCKPLTFLIENVWNLKTSRPNTCQKFASVLKIITFSKFPNKSWRSANQKVLKATLMNMDCQAGQ